MSDEKMVKVIDETGKEFMVDTSDEACGKLGYKNGERIINIYDSRIAKVVGVVPICPEKSNTNLVLWIEFEDTPGVAHGYVFPEIFFLKYMEE